MPCTNNSPRGREGKAGQEGPVGLLYCYVKIRKTITFTFLCQALFRRPLIISPSFTRLLWLHRKSRLRELHHDDVFFSESLVTNAPFDIWLLHPLPSTTLSRTCFTLRCLNLKKSFTNGLLSSLVNK
jgi:hypothetical protein